MPSPEVEVYTVDAFTSEPWAGNPAAVCVLEEERSEAWLQAVAAEMNLSETAYLRRAGDAAWRLRWFTPTQEVPLCGHATLASAHVLFETGRAKGEQVEFATRSGALGARAVGGGAIELDFPAYRSEPAPLPLAVVAALRTTPVAVRLVERAGREETWLLELESEAEVRRLAPDFAGAARSRRPGRDRDGARRRGRLRLRVALLRAGRRDRRGPGDGRRPLRARPVLGGAPRQDGAPRLAGLEARRGARRARRGGPRRALGRAVTVLRGALLR